MKIESKRFRVPSGKKVVLSKWPTTVEPVCPSDVEYDDLLAKHVRELSSLQQLHYASHHYALLLVFQGMDGAGKDGAIRHVMSGVNPEGCEVFSFRQPSAEELDHDFLWRAVCRLPERGRIGIFNRSYYEHVLVVRVHPELLRSQGLPEELRDENTGWEGRYADRAAHDGALGNSLVEWQRKIAQHWGSVHFGNVDVKTHDEQHFFRVEVFPGLFAPDEIRVELDADSDQKAGSPSVAVMTACTASANTRGVLVYLAETSRSRLASDYTPRVIPHHPSASVPLEASQIVWQR